MNIIEILRNILSSFRRKKYQRYAESRITKHGSCLRVNGPCIFSGTIIVGNNVNFNGMIISGKGKVIIGDNFHSGIDCMIITQNHNYDNGAAIPYDNTFVYKTITIEDNVWVGNRVIITGSITIGEGSIIAAGSVVCKDVPPLAVVGGNPARIIKYRDKNHYYSLKEQNKFF